MSNLGKTYHVDPQFRESLRAAIDKARYDRTMLDPSARISPDCNMIGSITIGARSAVLAGAILRADFEPITIADDSVIEDGVVIHGGKGHPVNIGEHTTIGHHCMLHGCTIGDNTLIGMNSCIMNNAVIGNNCLIGAGSLVTEDKVIPDRWMAYGHPVELVRELTDEEIQDYITIGAESYLLLTEKMLEEGILENPERSSSKSPSSSF